MSFFCFSRRVREMCFWQSAQNVHYILYIPQAHKSPSFGFRIAGALPRLFSNCAGRRGIRTILYPVRFKLIGTKIYLVDSPVIEKWVLRVWRGVGGGSRDVCQSVTMRSNQQIQSNSVSISNINKMTKPLSPEKNKNKTRLEENRSRFLDVIADLFPSIYFD
jgi:hypothetical protein